MAGVLEFTANVLEFGYGALAFLVGVGVLVLAPGKRVNQTLSWLLIVDGLTLGGMASNMRSWEWAGPQVQAGADAATALGWALVVPMYLLFTAYALQGGVSRWLRTWAGRATMVILFALQLVVMFGPGGLLDQTRADALNAVLFVAPLIGAGVVGLVAAVQNLAQASGTETRRQARAYLLAFAIRDGAYVLAYVFYATTVENLDWSAEGILLNGWLIALQLAWLMFLALLVYGILSGQVLDLDRRVRILAARTLALGFVGVAFVIITESVERFLDISNPIVGLGAAVSLAFVFGPVESAVERGARRFLPTTPVALADYKFAVERALADGKVTPSEQRVLDDLTRRLRKD